MTKNKKISSSQKYLDFLMSFFVEREGYEEKNVNGFYLIKHHDGKDWVVYVYTKQAYENYKEGQETYAEFRRQNDFLSSI